MEENNNRVDNVDNKDKMVKVKSLRRFAVVYFCLGIIASAVISAIVLFGVMDSKIVSSKTAEYYEGIDERYGKFYQMEMLIDKQALYKCKSEDVSDYISQSIVAGLKDDKYAYYFTAKEYEEFRRKFIDTYCGVGVVVVQDEDGHILVDRIIKDGPADKAGIKIGDEISEVDGKAVKSVEEAAQMLTGDVGTKVEITIKRKNKTKTYEMYRAEVEEESVDYSVYDKDKGIGYVQIRTFREGTSKEVKTAIKDLKNNRCDKVIIDLRGNTGGIMKESIEIADYLLPSCTITGEKIKDKKLKKYTSDESSCGVKYVLLVDGNTASASELLSAAVKENNAGIIIGTTTYGKGLIQTVHELKDGTAIKFTVGEYLSPKGNHIDGIGVEPDIKTSDAMTAAVEALLK